MLCGLACVDQIPASLANTVRERLNYTRVDIRRYSLIGSNTRHFGGLPRDLRRLDPSICGETTVRRQDGSRDPTMSEPLSRAPRKPNSQHASRWLIEELSDIEVTTEPQINGIDSLSAVNARPGFLAAPHESSTPGSQVTPEPATGPV